jgi:hypothetical protein
MICSCSDETPCATLEMEVTQQVMASAASLTIVVLTVTRSAGASLASLTIVVAASIRSAMAFAVALINVDGDSISWHSVVSLILTIGW